MYKVKFFIICSILSIHVLAQDIRNLYDPNVIQGETLETSIGGPPYDGEYQIVLNYLHWANLTSKYVSYSFECVSFPFIPKCFPYCLDGSDEVREFFAISEPHIPFDNYPIGGGESYPVSGLGWLYLDRPIFRITEPIGFLCASGVAEAHWISQETTLTSCAYCDVPNTVGKLFLPHTIIKINLNVHEGNTIGTDIAMQISWIYDNTRGRMRNYPFKNINSSGNLHKVQYDVLFVPVFHYRGYPDATLHSYNEQSNSDWYTGAFPSDMNLTAEGSINYYHPEDLDYFEYPYVPTSNFDQIDFPSIFYYPASYSLLAAPVTNSSGSGYAGYPIAYGGVETGIEHQYEIDWPIDLNTINPTEKIIYNPSEVTIDANITFPAGYKFLTVHGKYPDKSWVEYNNINNYEDLRDVLCPSDQVGINGEFLSEYIISWGRTLTVEEDVIIMDAKFSGLGTIKYNPYKVYGNFKIGENGPVKFYKIESDLTITQGQHYVWENNVELLAGKLTIENGASLTIHEKVYISPATQLVVERGGKLVISGGTLTNLDNGSDEMWQGIEVWGNPTLSSTESNQGTVYIVNGGTIENAIVGIRTVKTVQDERGETIELSYSGGIVKTSNANFINNRMAVSFSKYPAAGYSHQYTGFFTNNTSFETNNSYIGTNGPYYFIHMNDINKVGFANCSFINIDAQNTHSGIYSFNSQFHIKGSSSGSSGSISLFKGLNYGVYALASTPNRFPDISQTGFEDNQKGIYLSGISNAQVNCCNFTTSAAQTGGYGLYLDGCRNYWVEGNEFSHAGTGNLFGIYVNDTRPTGPEMIYRNYFAGLDVGIMAQNRNRTLSGEGLVLKCNEYVDTYWNQVVYFEGPVLNQEIGIASAQGADIELPDGPAGNLFSNSNPDSDTDIFNNANTFIYYHHINNFYPLEPLYYTEGKVFPEEVFGAIWNVYSCSPVTSSNGGELPGDEELRLLLATSSIKSDSIQDIIHLLKDGGDTEALKWEVDMSTSPEAYEVYNTLMNSSPYISDTVMAAAIEKESVLVNAMIRDVMVANPHNAKNEELLAKIDERVNPMPGYMKAQILQGRSLVSVFEELQSQLGFYKHQREAAFNELVKLYISDTVQPAASADSLMALLTAEQKPTAKYLKAAIYMNQGDWVSCLNVINTIPQQFMLTPEQAAEHAQMTVLYTLMAELVQDGNTLDELTPQQLNLLWDIESADAGIPSVYARNILIDLNATAYEEPVLYPNIYKSVVIQQEYTALKQALEQHHFIRISPNPAGNYLIIEHELDAVKGHPFAEIRNIKGEFEMIVRLAGIQNQQAIDISGLKPGTYTVTLFNGRQKVETVKFNKTR